MEFTTRFELHSQTARLVDAAPAASAPPRHGILTLRDAPFQGTCAAVRRPRPASVNYNSEAGGPRFKIWTVPASLAVTGGILVSFSSSAY
jgi:hypothetical protein